MVIHNGLIVSVAMIGAAKGSISGCIITFHSEENLPIDGKLLLTFEDKPHYFKITEKQTVKAGTHLEYKAVEVGYFPRLFNKIVDFDIRHIELMCVYPITDDATLKKIKEESTWC